MRKIYLIVFIALIGAWSVNAQKEMSKAGWSAQADSHYSARPVSDAIDEDYGTFWHNDWSVSDPLPHWIVVDFGAAHDINGFSYAPRSLSSGGNGTFKEYAFFVSTDSTTWDSIAGGTWTEPWGAIRKVTFPLQTGIRYMKIVAKSNNTDNSDWATCSEFGALIPGTDFEADTTTVIRLGTVNFTDLSGNSPTAWEWSFPGGVPATSTDQNPSVSYPTVGQFDVTLITKPDADPANNDTLTITNYITVLTGADFEADQTTVMRGGTVNFTDVSGNSPTGWLWAFPGGSPATSSEQNPSVTYNDAGQYDVILISIPDAGDPSKNDTIRKTNYITVDLPHIPQTDWVLLYEDSYQGNDHATNIFDGDPSTIWHTQYSPDDVPYPHEVILDLGATYSINGFTYTPRPGGGNGTVKDYEFYITKDTSNWGSPVYVGAWSAPWDADHKTFLPAAVIGRYIKWVTLSERNDNAWTSCAELNVMGGLFGSAFEADRTEILETNSVQFTDKSSYIPVAYEWIFDGGTPATSTERSPSVVYETAGTYTATLITTPASGAADNDTLVKTDYITVNPRPNMKKLSRDGWSLIYVDSEETPNERYATNVFDGDYTTIWHTAWSQEEPPYPHEIIIDLGANYDLTGFMYAPRPDGGNGTVAQYEFYTSLDADQYTLADSGTWSGDWTSERTQEFQAPVTARFIRFVALSEKNGNAWASCSELNVLVSITGAEFQSDKQFVTKGGAVYFTDLSAGNPTSWSWTFEGGTPATSTERSPKVVYNELGTYDVTLTVDGSVYTEKQDYIEVNYKIPQIGTGVYIDTVQIGNVLAHFSGQEGGYVDNLDIVATLVRDEVYMVNITHIVPWDGYDSRQGAWIDWNNDGVFDEDELIVSDTIVTPIKVPADAALGMTRMRVLGRLWGGTPDPYENVDYGEIEDYTINIVELAAGVPVADFEADSTSICAQTAVGFTDLTTNTPTSWSWTFEGGTPATSDMQNPVVIYETPGTYEVSLTASQTSGSDTETKTAYITVNDLPAVSGGDDQEVCQGTMITLSGSGTDVYEWDNDVIDGVPFEQTADSMAYIVTGYSASGCMNTDTVIVKVKLVNVAVNQSQSSDTLTAYAEGAIYQWINCADNSPVEGATEQQFVATENGEFAVIVTENECSDTSICYAVVGVGIGDNNFGAKISIYPNPNNGNFTVKLGVEKATINVYNALGRLVYSRKDASEFEELNLDTKGLYFIEIRTDNAVETRRVIVQ